MTSTYRPPKRQADAYMKRTKIICTIGPASTDPAILFKMGEAGMDIARLNFSHGTHADHARLVKNLRLVGKRLGKQFGILQDLQGPKIRVGDLPKEGVKLVAGERAVFSTAVSVAAGDIPVTVPMLHEDVHRGERLLLDDGLMDVTVERVEGRRIITRVGHGGVLFSHKGLNLPETSLKLPALSEKDRSDAEFGVELGVDMIALSFVRSAKDIHDLRKLLDKKGAAGRRIRIVAKIEKPEAVEQFDEILEATDAVMVARGDLGIEMPAAEVPVIQKDIVSRCRAISKPAIVATQMLDSMTRNPRPTRAEVSDVANAVDDHVDAVMLSGETANGSYPVEVVRMMSDTIISMERSRFDDVNPVEVTQPRHVPEAIGATVRVLTEALCHPPIVIATASGLTAIEVSSFRPESSIYALTFDETVARYLRLVWGVQPIYIPRKKTPELMIQAGIDLLKRQHLLKSGERVVFVTGHVSGKPGTANKIEINNA